MVPLGQWPSARRCPKDAADCRNKNLLNSKGKTQMKDKLLKLSVMLQILKDENGQDLIEYALVVALIAFGSEEDTSELQSLINLACRHILEKMTNYIT